MAAFEVENVDDSDMTCQQALLECMLVGASARTYAREWGVGAV
jgi:hypothetical protein